MTIQDPKIKLSQYYLKLQNSNNIQDETLLQDIVIYLTAKDVIEDRKNKTNMSTSLDSIFDSILNSLDYQDTLDNYLLATKSLMPAFFQRFSASRINNSIENLIQDDKGLQKCYSFLKIKEFDVQRQCLQKLNAVRQVNNVLKDGQIAKTSSHVINQKIELFQEGQFFELSITNLDSGVTNRIETLKSDIESVGHIFFENNDIKLQLNRVDNFFETEITSIFVIDKSKKWAVEYHS